MAAHPSTLAWKIPWTEPSRLVHGVAQSQTQLSNFTFTFTLGFCSSFQCKPPALYISSPLFGISGNGVTCPWQYKCSMMIFRNQSPIYFCLFVVCSVKFLLPVIILEKSRGTGFQLVFSGHFEPFNKLGFVVISSSMLVGTLIVEGRHTETILTENQSI